MASSKKVNGIEPQAQLDVEFGSVQTFPTASWAEFAYGKSHGNADGAFVIARDASAVPLKDLVEMRRRDGQTRALLRLFTLPILSCLKEAEWVAPEYIDGGADEEVEFANQMFRLPPAAGGMTSSLDTIMRYTLLGILEGFSVFEEVRQIPDSGPLKGKITLRKLAHRDASTIKFRVDETGGFNGVNQTFKNHKGELVTVTIPKEKSWFWTANFEENPFYGVSFFETAWYHYEIKTKLYYIAHIASQFAAVPGRIGKAPQNATGPQKAAFAKALQTFAFNTSLVVPHDYDVDSFNGTTGFNFLSLIDHHAHMQAKSVLMQFADTEDRMVLIDNGKADASADMYIKALESIMAQIAESWTVHLMPKYIDWNFGSHKYPVFRFGQLSDSAKDGIREVFTSVVTSSVLNCTPEFIREMEKKLAVRFGLDIDYETIEGNEQEAARQQAAQAAAQAELEALQGAQAAPEGGAAPAGPPAPESPPAPPTAALSAYDLGLDEVFAAAQNLLLSRPQDGVLGVDDAIGVSDEEEE